MYKDTINNEAIPTLHATYSEEESRYICNILGHYCFKKEEHEVLHTLRDKRLPRLLRRARVWIKKNSK